MIVFIVWNFDTVSSFYFFETPKTSNISTGTLQTSLKCVFLQEKTKPQ